MTNHEHELSKGDLERLFHAAMKNDARPIVEFVASYPQCIDVPGIGKRFTGKSLLMAAIQSHAFDVAELLIDSGANVNYRNDPTSILSAAVGMAISADQDSKPRWVDLMKKLLQAGANPNAPCARGTVLSFALTNYSRHYDNYWIIELLLNHGGDMNSHVEKLGMTLQQFVDLRASPKWASPGLLKVLGVEYDKSTEDE